MTVVPFTLALDSTVSKLEDLNHLIFIRRLRRSRPAAAPPEPGDSVAPAHTQAIAKSAKTLPTQPEMSFGPAGTVISRSVGRFASQVMALSWPHWYSPGWHFRLFYTFLLIFVFRRTHQILQKKNIFTKSFIIKTKPSRIVNCLENRETTICSVWVLAPGIDGSGLLVIVVIEG